MPNRTSKKNAPRSKRFAFIAEHRGGPLTKKDHRRLIRWARICCEHVLPLLGKKIDPRLKYALTVAEEWENGNCSAGKAMKAALGAHEVARVSKDPVQKAIARAIGQTVATAHMADHSLGGAFYALKAVKFTGGNIQKEKEWQIKKLNTLPSTLVDIVQAIWKRKGLDKRI